MGKMILLVVMLGFVLVLVMRASGRGGKSDRPGPPG